MKTNQLMKRDFNGTSVEQRTDNSFLNATDLLSIYNANAKTQKRIKEFWDNKGTDDFVDALIRMEQKEIGGNSPLLKSDLILTTKGRNGSTFMHPYLFIKFAMWLSADFEVKVIKWVYDNLIKVRNEAGDYYIELCDAIQKRYLSWSNGKKPDPLIFIKEANYLKELAFGYKDKGRNEATEDELKLLNALQKANIKLINEGVGKDERWLSLRNFAKLY